MRTSGLCCGLLEAPLTLIRFTQEALTTTAYLPWQRTSLWVSPTSYSLIHRFQTQPQLELSSTPNHPLVFECALSSPRLAYLWEHAVNGRAVLPAAGYIEMAVAAVWTAVAGGFFASTPLAVASAAGLAANTAAAQQATVMLLQNVAIPAPLLLGKKPVSGASALVLTCKIDTSSGKLSISSSLTQALAAANSAGKTEHLSAVLSLTHTVSTCNVAHQAAQSAHLVCSSSILTLMAAAALYVAPAPAATLASAGQDGETDVPATASLSAAPITTDGHAFHPAMLDSLLQLGAAGSATAGRLLTPKVPVAIHAISLPLQPVGPSAFAAASPASLTGGMDYVLGSQTGSNWCSTIRGLQAKPLVMVTPAAAATAAATVSTLPGISVIGGSKLAASELTVMAKDCLYDISWCADEPCGAVEPDTNISASVPAMCLTPAAANAAAGPTALNTLTQCASALAVVQQSAAQKLPISVHNSSQHKPLTGLGSHVESSMVEAMLRCVVREGVTVSTSATAGMGNAAAAETRISARKREAMRDVYNSSQRSGVNFSARLVPALASSGGGDFGLVPMPRGALTSLIPHQISAASLKEGQVRVAPVMHPKGRYGWSLSLFPHLALNLASQTNSDLNYFRW